eukprot:28437-Chlamydomonas_euryale.AAC.9
MAHCNAASSPCSCLQPTLDTAACNPGQRLPKHIFTPAAGDRPHLIPLSPPAMSRSSHACSHFCRALEVVPAV